MIAGHASPEGTARFAARFPLPGHFREVDGLRLSSVGLGTYLGGADAATDALQHAAAASCLGGGVNVIDCAINYRNMRSERAVGAALQALVASGAIARDEVFVATKGGFIPFDDRRPADPAEYVQRTVVESGLARADEVVAGCHCLAPRWIESQIARSRENLGLETIDLYYLHNPETQLDEVSKAAFHDRMRGAFGVLEAAVAAGHIRRYGVATWDGLRTSPTGKGHVSLESVFALARDAGGSAHHFRVVQLPFSLAMPEALTAQSQSVDGESGPALLAAKALGLHTMASAPLMQSKLTRGLPPLVREVFPGLTSDAQRAIQFARSAPALDVALVGMKRAEHVTEDLATCAVAPASQEQFMRLFGG